MNSISEVELNKTEESLHEEPPVSKKKRKRNLFIRIFLFFIGRFLHLLFLFLLFIRTPVRAILSFFAGGSMLMLFFFVYGYLLDRGTSPMNTELIIGGFIFACVCLCLTWAYDALLLRLAPPGYDIALFL
ncbi:hypothetical protein [Bartonella melophagi]|uniref:Uncharacterized protein n=1 Tax=Bartonella melophagi K-2C TaxID=1094557 RepID=J0QY35_9HYPH|nr:hypothetical protein [Bartonella melophagi]EJF88109.1 hypothetical protein ME3_01264 [Bartonella melophagi K-2C]